MIVRQLSDGRWYVVNTMNYWNFKKMIRPRINFIVKYYKDGGKVGLISLNKLVLPKEFVGKRVRVIVEEVKD